MAQPEEPHSVDRFLNLVKSSKRGKLKIYLGLAAGVGKTYRMLQEAHDLSAHEVDVCLGFIETHNRVETVRLTENLPEISRRKIFYKGREMEELDVDAVIRRHPDVVLIDELAHTNVPGSKNEKRWQDVIEVLDHGISVISALNIQHIESLNHIVEKITGIEVKERVPDSILKMADEVVNVDLTVNELLKRLEEGKIYAPEKVKVALQNFFKKDTLLQLRELALREVANQVERKIDTEVILSPQKSGDDFIACISTNDKIAKRVIRKTSRLASRFDAEWYVVYVQTPVESNDKINLADQRHLINNFQLATELGGEVHRLKGDDIVKEILKFSKQKGTVLIICGQSKSTVLERLLGKDVIGKLQKALKNSGIDIFIVN